MTAAGLLAQLVHRAFPFHFTADPDGRFIQVGAGLSRLCPAARPGACVEDVLGVRTPQGFRLTEPGRRDSGSVELTSEAVPELLLRGQVTVLDDVLWFLGSPWVADLAALGRLGLSSADFDAHDSVPDRLFKQERRLAAEPPDLALRLDANGLLLEVRPAREGEMATADERLVGLTGLSAYEAFPWLAADLPGAVERALVGTKVQELTAKVDTDGQLRHYEVRVVGAAQDEVLVLVRDVSEGRNLQEQLRHRAFHDPLTGLANRSLFADRIEHALAGIGRAAAAPVLLLIDLDDFKAVNDVHGHLIGDELLTTVGQRLAAVVRPQDTVARLGGDEFAVLLHDGGRAEGERVATRLLDSLRRPVRMLDRVLQTSASIGVVGANRDDDLTSLFRHGDMALYAAKQAGRKQFRVFDDDLRQRGRDRRSLQVDLREAIQHGELTLHYQPIRDLESGTTYGWEALMRWQHPHLGLLSPDVFLRIAEDIGAMDVLAERMLRRATHDSHRLGALVHVNLSPSQLSEPSIVEVVADALDGAGLPGSRLVLALTETALRQGDDVLATMQALRELGVGLSLDDFGVGFSSLSRLHTLPFTEVKIDRSFVTGLGEAGRDAIAKAVAGVIVNLGGELGLTVVAEGVETELQAAQLRGIGCRLGQGFHLGRPAAAP